MNKSFYEIEVDAAFIKKLPETVQLILQKLSLETNLAIKGGVARLVLLEIINERLVRINNQRLEIERNISDLDIILVHRQSLGKSKEALVRRERAIKQRLKDVSVVFHGQDVDPVKSKKGGLNPETIKKFLDTRDMTVNQVLLMPEDGQWKIVYTENCRRDLVAGIGMLCTGDTKVTRYDIGRIIAGGRGLFRLIRFLARGKINKIWLPQWMLEAHLSEMKRLQEEDEVPIGGNLGFYGKILAGQFQKESDDTKKWLIAILRELHLTDAKSYEEYRDQQFSIFPDTEEKSFDPERDIPFSERIDEILEQQKKRQEGQQGRNQERNTCEHEYQTFKCNGCEERCKIEKCRLCTSWKLPEEGLTCNKIFIAGNREKNPDGLRTINFDTVKSKAAKK